MGLKRDHVLCNIVLQANVYPNNPRVALFWKGISAKLSISIILRKIQEFLAGIDRPQILQMLSCFNAPNLVYMLQRKILEKICSEQMFIIQQFNSQHLSSGEKCLRKKAKGK